MVKQVYNVQGGVLRRKMPLQKGGGGVNEQKGDDKNNNNYIYVLR